MLQEDILIGFKNRRNWSPLSTGANVFEKLLRTNNSYRIKLQMRVLSKYLNNIKKAVRALDGNWCTAKWCKPQNQSCDRKRPRDPAPPSSLSPPPYPGPQPSAPRPRPRMPPLLAAAGPPDPDKTCPSCHSSDAYKCIALIIITRFHVR